MQRHGCRNIFQTSVPPLQAFRLYERTEPACWQVSKILVIRITHCSLALYWPKPKNSWKRMWKVLHKRPVKKSLLLLSFFALHPPSSERIFSEVSAIYKRNRSRLLGEHAEQLCFLHHSLGLLNETHISVLLVLFIFTLKTKGGYFVNLFVYKKCSWELPALFVR